MIWSVVIPEEHDKPTATTLTLGRLVIGLPLVSVSRHLSGMARPAFARFGKPLLSTRAKKLLKTEAHLLSAMRNLQTSLF